VSIFLQPYIVTQELDNMVGSAASSKFKVEATYQLVEVSYYDVMSFSIYDMHSYVLDKYINICQHQRK
jgi:hypothetical protein